MSFWASRLKRGSALGAGCIDLAAQLPKFVSPQNRSFQPGGLYLRLESVRPWYRRPFDTNLWGSALTASSVRWCMN